MAMKTGMAKTLLAAGVLGVALLATAQVKNAASSANAGLVAAVKAGQAAKIDALIHRGADPNVRDKYGMTPLHYAAYRGDAASAKALLKDGADPNAKDSLGMTPLHAAAFAAHSAVLKVLLKGGAKVAMKDSLGNTALHYAAYKKSVEAVRILLAAGADRAAVNKKGATPAEMAAASGSREIAGMLSPAGRKKAPKVITNETLANMSTDDHFVIQQNQPLAGGHAGSTSAEYGSQLSPESPEGETTRGRIDALTKQIRMLKREKQQLEESLPSLEKRCDEFKRLQNGEQVGLTRRAPPPDSERGENARKRYYQAVENDRNSSCGALQRAKQRMGRIALEIATKEREIRLLTARANRQEHRK